MKRPEQKMILAMMVLNVIGLVGCGEKKDVETFCSEKVCDKPIEFGAIGAFRQLVIQSTEYPSHQFKSEVVWDMTAKTVQILTNCRWQRPMTDTEQQAWQELVSQIRICQDGGNRQAVCPSYAVFDWVRVSAYRGEFELNEIPLDGCWSTPRLCEVADFKKFVTLQQQLLKDELDSCPEGESFANFQKVADEPSQ